MAGVSPRNVKDFKLRLDPTVYELNDKVMVQSILDPKYKKWYLMKADMDHLVGKMAEDERVEANKKPSANSEFAMATDTIVRDVKLWNEKEAIHHWIELLCKYNKFLPPMAPAELEAAKKEEKAGFMPARRAIKALPKAKPLSDLDNELLELAGADTGMTDAQEAPKTAPAPSSSSSSFSFTPPSQPTSSRGKNPPISFTITSQLPQQQGPVTSFAPLISSAPAAPLAPFSFQLPSQQTAPTASPAAANETQDFERKLEALESRVKTLEAENDGLKAKCRQHQQQQESWKQEAAEMLQKHEQQQLSWKQEAEELVRKNFAAAEEQLAESEASRRLLHDQCQKLSAQVVEERRASLETEKQLVAEKAAALDRAEAQLTENEEAQKELSEMVEMNKHLVEQVEKLRKALMEATTKPAMPHMSPAGTQTEDLLPPAAPLALPRLALTTITTTATTAPLLPPTATPSASSSSSSPLVAFPYAAILQKIKTRPAALRPRGQFQVPTYEYSQLATEISTTLQTISPSLLPLTERLVDLLTFLTWDSAPRSAPFAPLVTASRDAADNITSALNDTSDWTSPATLAELVSQIHAVQAATTAYEACFADFWAKPQCTLDTLPRPDMSQLVHGMPPSFKVARARRHLDSLVATFTTLGEEFDLGPLAFDDVSPFVRFATTQYARCSSRLERFEVKTTRRVALPPVKRVRMPEPWPASSSAAEEEARAASVGPVGPVRPGGPVEPPVVAAPPVELGSEFALDVSLDILVFLLILGGVQLIWG